jgi:hypothetical protein
MPKSTLYNNILKELKELKKRYPSYTMGKHIATALDEYRDVWGMTDKEFLFAITKYKATMEMDVPHETEDRELQKIINDGMNLHSILDEEEDY